MFDQLKNLIRHGKQANLKGSQRIAHNRFPKTPAPQTAKYDAYPDIAPRTKVDGSALAQIVAEENVERARMPKYPGLQKYKILEKMGDGAFSTVYKAVDTVTQQRVAIKVVRKYELSQSQERHLHRDVKKQPRAIERANILKEVQIMRQLKHPSIVQLLSFTEDKDFYYLVLELMEGGELFHQIVKLTYFSETLSRHVIVQVAEGIRYLHEEKGVVHRDIKPENLLFEPIDIIPSKDSQAPPGPNDEPKEDEGEFIPGVGGGGIGRIKIADFGLSKIVWDEQTMTPCGTVGYTAPEIVKDQRYSKSVDMWAVGCVLYTLLCGFPPFYDESIPILTEKVSKGQYTFLSPWWDPISTSARDLVSHLLEVDPEKRYTIQEFFEHPWIKDQAKDAEPDNSQVVATAVAQPTQTDTNQELATPDVTTSRLHKLLPPETFSPGIASLKEAFDVSYAVHRMEEEDSRKRKMKANPNNAPREHFLRNVINRMEQDEDEGDDNDESSGSSEESSPVTSTTPHSNEPVKMKTGAPRAKERRRGFDLNLEGATLLSRRRKALEAIGS